ncbi:MAG: hypothetical protein NTZ39_04140 [Methanoregula sp.]|nr:hypothetical protein [Methanoregula sp.]
MIRSQDNFRRTWFGVVFILLFATGLVVSSVGAVSLPSQGTQSSSTVISKGDPVSIHGIATGHPQNGLQVWLISNNYLKVSTIPVESDNTYTYELTRADTQNIAGGQYFVVIQHPMMNGQFDVVYNPSTGTVTNRQLGGGTTIFQMSGTGSLQSPSSATALVAAISSQNIDDTFVTYSVFVNDPTAFVSPIPDHVVGDQFTISGSTNLAVGDDLMVEITSASFKPTPKTQDGGFSGASGMVKVVPGSGGYNHWSFDVDTSTFKPDTYIVIVRGVLVSVTGSTTFNVLQTPVNTQYTVVPTLSITPSVPATPVTPVPTTIPATTQKSPVAVSIGIAALAIAFFVREL